MSDSERGWPLDDFEARFKPLLHQMTENRGWLINTFCQVEFLLADLIVKCRKFDEYVELNNLQLPFGLDNRIHRVRELAATGPLSKYSEQLERLFSDLLEKEEIRHFFAHGYGAFHITKDGQNCGLYFKRYRQPKKGERETLSDLMVTPGELEEARIRWTKFGEDSASLFDAIFANLGLEKASEPIKRTNEETAKP